MIISHICWVLPTHRKTSGYRSLKGGFLHKHEQFHYFPPLLDIFMATPQEISQIFREIT